MKILGFGEEKDDSPHKKKEKKEVPANIGDAADNNIPGNIEDDEPENIEDNDDNIDDNDDYIDPDNLDYSEYEDIVESIENEGWTRISSAGLYPISTSNIEIVFPRPVKRDTYDTVLEIICPPDRIITICGFNQCDIDEEKFFDSPNLYTRPHFLTLRCAADDNMEISPRTIIGISKITKDDKMEKFYQEFYGDLSPTIDGRLKKKQERYYLAETIILQKGEKLVFQIHHLDIDISKIDLLMMADLFKKDEEESTTPP